MDTESGVLVGRLDTERIGHLVDAQRPWEGHPKHVPGAVVIQMTGTLANLHAFYALGLRGSEGWTGYGVVIKRARFHRLGKIGPDVIARLEVTKTRQFAGKRFISYAFRFEQEGELFYRSDQTAVWYRPADGVTL
jgi:hypothetical protein